MRIVCSLRKCVCRCACDEDDEAPRPPPRVIRRARPLKDMFKERRGLRHHEMVPSHDPDDTPSPGLDRASGSWAIQPRDMPAVLRIARIVEPNMLLRPAIKFSLSQPMTIDVTKMTATMSFPWGDETFELKETLVHKTISKLGVTRTISMQLKSKDQTCIRFVTSVNGASLHEEFTYTHNDELLRVVKAERGANSTREKMTLCRYVQTSN
jgi:hypothetical protein